MNLIVYILGIISILSSDTTAFPYNNGNPRTIVYSLSSRDTVSSPIDASLPTQYQGRSEINPKSRHDLSIRTLSLRGWRVIPRTVGMGLRVAFTTAFVDLGQYTQNPNIDTGLIPTDNTQWMSVDTLKGLLENSMTNLQSLFSGTLGGTDQVWYSPIISQNLKLAFYPPEDGLLNFREMYDFLDFVSKQVDEFKLNDNIIPRLGATVLGQTAAFHFTWGVIKDKGW